MDQRKLELRRQVFEREALAHLDLLLRTAKRVVPATVDAEDIVQETYLRAWKHFDSFETGSNCRAWLFRILFNVINSKRGNREKHPEMPLAEEEHQQAQLSNVIAFDPLKEIESKEVLAATNFLSPEHRAVLWLVVVEELSYREAAGILEVPIGTVMSRLHRARRELRALLMSSRAGAQTADGR